MEGKKEKEEKVHTCNNKGCSKEAKLRCPNCKKLGIKAESYFCGKECFQASWAEHKNIHDEYSPIEDDFEYTGPLRPYKISPRREVPKTIQCPDYAYHPDGVSESEELANKTREILVYSEEDIEQMKVVCKLGRLVLDTAHKAVAVGVTTDELDQIVHETAIENDCYPSPLNYYKFPKSVCTSVNEVICHGIPDRRPLKSGDIVNLDVTVYHHGYHGDLNETYLVVSVDKKGKNFLTQKFNKPNILLFDQANIPTNEPKITIVNRAITQPYERNEIIGYKSCGKNNFGKQKNFSLKNNFLNGGIIYLNQNAANNNLNNEIKYITILDNLTHNIQIDNLKKILNLKHILTNE